MRATLLAAVAILAFATPLEAQVVAPTAYPGAGPTTLSVTAEHRAEQAPDVADLSAGVVTGAPSASEAMRANAERMTTVIAALRRAGIAERDIQTSGLSLQPQYVYRENQPPRLSGYQAINNVTVQVHKLGEIGRILDTLVQQGANQISGPVFRLDQVDPALDAARLEAVRKARARADLYAKATGMRVKRILQINDGGVAPPQPYPIPVVREAMAKDASTPIQPGAVQLIASVNVVYELE